MATPLTSDPDRSWSRLAQRAAGETAPAIDVRFAVRRALAAELISPSPLPWADEIAAAVLALFRTTWLRLAIGSTCALLLGAGFFGWQAAESLSDPLLWSVADFAVVPSPIQP